MSGYVVINPVDKTVDGIFTHQETAYEAAERWAERYKEPMVYVTHTNKPWESLLETYKAMQTADAYTIGETKE